GLAGASVFAAGAGLTTAAPSAEILPTTVFTWTVVPSGTLISSSTPEAGAGISASTLSVEISNSGSSRCTFSPGFFSHLVIVPSNIDSPICGITTSVAIKSTRSNQNFTVRTNLHYIRRSDCHAGLQETGYQ